MADSSATYAFVKDTHPIYDACREEWERNERRMIGGEAVWEELLNFDWEDVEGDHYKARQRMAVYPKYPDRFATIMVGHMMRNAPEEGAGLSFGALGSVARTEGAPSPAELVFYNVDGVGSDGSQWDTFWSYVAKMAIGTGHRWLMVEGPPEAPANRAEEISGMRPFVTHLSPIDVTNWHYIRGRLSFLVFTRRVRNLTITNGSLGGNEGALEYVLYVAKGFTVFDEVLPGASSGKWFIINEDADELLGDGDLDATDGEIPCLPFYYERMTPSEEVPRISRSGVSELGNAAIGYMNVVSAADFDAWDSASTVTAILGADIDAFNIFLGKVKAGSRYVPLPPNVQTGPDQVQGQIKDLSAGAVVSGVFKDRLDSKKQDAIELMMQEMQSAPYASGVSKKATWTDTRAPRLAMFAGEIETAQNAVIRWLEQLWGKTPDGVVNWPRSFELIDINDVAEKFFQMETLAGINSKTLDAKILTQVAKRNGFFVDDITEEAVQGEYDAASEIKRKAAELAATPQPTVKSVSVQRDGNGRAASLVANRG